MKITLYIAQTLLLCSLLNPSAAHAQQFKNFDEVGVHYSVVNTTFIDPSVAATYGITRGKRRAMLNISVLDATTGKARKALVSGSVRELINAQTLEFREVQEQQAIYYIAEFHILDQQLHRFDLEVRLSANQPPLSLELEQKIYADP